MSKFGKLILAAFAAFILLAVMRRQEPATSEESEAPPAYSVHVLSVECQPNYGRNRADVAVVNTGSTAIPYATAFVTFKDAAGQVVSTQSTYFRPDTIQPGATASARVFASEGAPQAATCGPSAIQDRDGNPVAIQ
jgi:hypothetical protein